MCFDPKDASTTSFFTQDTTTVQSGSIQPAGQQHFLARIACMIPAACTTARTTTYESLNHKKTLTSVGYYHRDNGFVASSMPRLTKSLKPTCPTFYPSPFRRFLNLNPQDGPSALNKSSYEDSYALRLTQLLRVMSKNMELILGLRFSPHSFPYLTTF